MTRNEVIFSGQLKQYLADWYYQDGQYYSVISEDVVGETGQLVFDFSTRGFKEKRTKGKISTDKKLKVFNDPLTYKNCNCGKYYGRKQKRV